VIIHNAGGDIVPEAIKTTFIDITDQMLAKPDAAVKSNIITYEVSNCSNNKPILCEL
jgi:hypothetical protein